MASKGLHLEVASQTATELEIFNPKTNLLSTREQTKLLGTSEKENMIDSCQENEPNQRCDSQSEHLYLQGDQQADWAALAAEGLALASRIPCDQGVYTPKHEVDIIRK